MASKFVHATVRHARPQIRMLVSKPATATIALRFMSSSFDPHPSPLRLPAKEQAEFERLLREASESVAAAELADAVRAANEKAAATAAAGSTVQTQTAPLTAVAPGTIPEGTSGNPVEGVWRGAAPEFDGDRNPLTGEVGGPKTEPLRWGSNGDWSFNGRVTDF
ncbi:hypothetical protein CMQ_6796 [Grosmannia clavigera kw1407]|uniref:Succinate dehydrogenase assembly factor 4, mitochondrial n=1 Tax=Grosmannia clavigera (strain kw1407 / UAMH 11150) TaxID=655863 RepID=F0X7V1_GROCL|nr:uncharacterized protein CMQ_6796 [Grosmannia clavigera kw1407]EFX06475.1 hypothetical protein CMQ_6796 [Grosmannia clavigera kw1407]